MKPTDPQMPTMTGKQMQKALAKMKLNKSQTARGLRSYRSTVWRWLTGERAIPGPVQALVEIWQKDPEHRPE